MRGRGYWLIVMLMIVGAASVPLLALIAFVAGPVFAMWNFALYCRLKKRGVI